MGFGKRWIKRCVMCTSVSVLVNGFVRGEFKMERLLRQGSSLLPLLFYLVVKFLPILVNQYEDNQWLQNMYIQRVMDITNIIQYSENTILFLGQSVNLEGKLRKCLFIFSNIKELHIDLRKSRSLEWGWIQRWFST